MKKMQQKSKKDTNIQDRTQTPPQTKGNKNKRQTQIKTPTTPEVENTKLYQLSLDKPHDKLRPLKQ
jgi:hypothetical protein